MSSLDALAPLSPESLSAPLDPASLPFTTTEDFEPYGGVLGQERAMRALEFGIGMNHPGYNIFVMGEPGSGRLSLTLRQLREQAKTQSTPADWLYLNNFAEPREPIALKLPAGAGRSLQIDLEGLVDNLLATLPSVFENPGYQRRKAAIDREFNERYEKAIEQVERRGRENQVALFRDGDTISFAPLLGGEPVSDEEFAALSDADKEKFHKQAKALEEYLAEILMELPQWKREANKRLRELKEEAIGNAMTPLIKGLVEKYAEFPGVTTYLDAVRDHLLRGPAQLHSEEHPQEPKEEVARRTALIETYAPKLLVSHVQGTGAPVLHEANPTYQNLFGRIEYVNEQGVLVTRHRLICPGALHLANGGYLVLEAEKLLSEPPVWPALKRALKAQGIRIENPGLDSSAGAAMTLNPEIIPLDIKIVLVGERGLFYLLQEMDDEFTELFRVLVDFDDWLTRDETTVLTLIGLIKHQIDTCGFRDLTAAAAARLIEFGSRLGEHQKRLSARIGEIKVLISESETQRKLRGDRTIDRRHVEQALKSKAERMGRIGQELLSDMVDGIILIDTEGVAVGRVNGLTVLEVGDSRFGSPARITATVSPGRRGVVDIEREAALGQAIHSKGVMILVGYLYHRYAHNQPLDISATLALEQSYGYIDGDSAALAEVLALISALAGVPLRQSLAVTGSINQHGEVQAVGLVNEKIEGFFRLCKARGFKERQGVIIPTANRDNLVLDSEVVEAARDGKFAVYAVSTVDDALTLLTGKPARLTNGAAVTRLRAMRQSKGVTDEP